jgi:hypothetical protein
VSQKEYLSLVVKVRQLDGDHIQWPQSFLWNRMVEMIIVDNTMERHPVEAGVPQGSPVSPIHVTIYTPGLIKWVKEYVSEAKGLSFEDDPGGVVAETDGNFVFSILERCAARSSKVASRRGLQFYTMKTETTPSETPPDKPVSKEKSHNQVDTIQCTSDTLTVHLDGPTSDVPGASQPMNKDRQGSRSQTRDH